MPFDTQAAAHYADSHAQAHSTGNCAKYVRRAIGHGGIQLATTHSARNYGPILEAAGFTQVTGTPQRGDVAVIQSIPGHPDGHMAIFDGQVWVSDFKQHAGVDGFYPGQAYRTSRPPYRIYRHNN